LTRDKAVDGLGDALAWRVALRLAVLRIPAAGQKDTVRWGIDRGLRAFLGTIRKAKQ
jgi:hypothetical protein